MPERFFRIRRLPPYILSEVVALTAEARRRGEDIIDLGMGNPDIPSPPAVVDKLCEAVQNPRNHRYSSSRGIPKLRRAITDWYKRRYDVDLDPETEAIATIGAKEGLSHLVLATVGPGDVVFVPTPTYPIHSHSVSIAGGDLVRIPITTQDDFFDEMMHMMKRTWPAPKMLLMSFPHNPTTRIETLGYFERVVDFARENNIFVVHDLAYADICFDGYEAPSLLQVPGAKDIGVEFYSMSKGYSMPGWRVAFCVGNRDLVHALTRLKSYLDYGIFQPIQIASIIALNGSDDYRRKVCATYKARRDALCEGLSRAGWRIDKPQATMFVWAKIPSRYAEMGSLKFSKALLSESKVAVSPGIGFGYEGDGHVRFALIENEHRIQQAVRGIRRFLQKTE